MVPHNLDWMPLIVQLTSSLTSLVAAYSLESRTVTSATKTTDTTAHGVICVPCVFIVFLWSYLYTWHGGISVAAERQLPCLMNFTRRVMHFFFPNLAEINLIGIFFWQWGKWPCKNNNTRLNLESKLQRDSLTSEANIPSLISSYRKLTYKCYEQKKEFTTGQPAVHFLLSHTQFFDRSWPRLNILLTVTCNIQSAGTVSQCKVVHPSIPGELHFSVPLMCLRYCIEITAMLPTWSQVSRDTSHDF